MIGEASGARVVGSCLEGALLRVLVWNPGIEHAPKDGREMIFFGRTPLGSPMYALVHWGTQWGQINEDHERGWNAGWGNWLHQIQCEFTHWAEIPAPDQPVEPLN